MYMYVVGKQVKIKNQKYFGRFYVCVYKQTSQKNILAYFS